VLTTVIILVSSVILGSGVVLYGTSLFQGNTLVEGFSVSEIKLWIHDTDPIGIAWGAVGIRNTGDTGLAVHKIIVRGVNVPVGQWYVDRNVTNAAYSAGLNHTGWANADPGADGPSILKLGDCVISTF